MEEKAHVSMVGFVSNDSFRDYRTATLRNDILRSSLCELKSHYFHFQSTMLDFPRSGCSECKIRQEALVVDCLEYIDLYRTFGNLLSENSSTGNHCGIILAHEWHYAWNNLHLKQENRQ